MTIPCSRPTTTTTTTTTPPATSTASDDCELIFRFLSFADGLRAQLLDIATETNLLPADLLALRAIAANGAPIHPFELALRLRCSRSYVTEITQRLLAAGCITEHRIPYAPRSKRLALTQLGRDVFADAITLLNERSPFAFLRPRDHKRLAGLVIQLTADRFEDEDAFAAPCPKPLRWRSSSAAESPSLGK